MERDLQHPLCRSSLLFPQIMKAYTLQFLHDYDSPAFKSGRISVQLLISYYPVNIETRSQPNQSDGLPTCLILEWEQSLTFSFFSRKGFKSPRDQSFSVSFWFHCIILQPLTVCLASGTIPDFFSASPLVRLEGNLIQEHNIRSI